MDQIKIVEVGPRDGLQNLPAHLCITPKDRITMVQKLAAAGLSDIEIGSFVSPKHVPQMQDTDKVLAGLYQAEAIKNNNKNHKIHKIQSVNPENVKGYRGDDKDDMAYITLTPNQRGFDDAIAAGAQYIAVFISASESFSRKNVNMSMQESAQIAMDITAQAVDQGIQVRGYISCVFGCPYEGKMDLDLSADLADLLLESGCYEISFGDTIGVASPSQVHALADLLSFDQNTSNDNMQYALHMHQTYGQALANIYAGLEAGFSVFDSSIAGLGGCPFAPGATGNVATEDLLYLLQGMNLAQDIDMDSLLSTVKWIKKLGLPIHSAVAKAHQALDRQ
jgi:hydroxymethylglutaryl-CoA lyase